MMLETEVKRIVQLSNRISLEKKGIPGDHGKENGPGYL